VTYDSQLNRPVKQAGLMVALITFWSVHPRLKHGIDRQHTSRKRLPFALIGPAKSGPTCRGKGRALPDNRIGPT